MKNLVRLSQVLVVAFLATAFVACSDDDDNNNNMGGDDPQTIADFVATNEDYSMLEEALVRTGLDATLDGSGTFTVFAPNNAAFNAYLGGAAVADVEVDALTQLLLNHVLSTTEMAEDLATGYINNMATYADTDANLSMYLEVDGATVNINGGTTAEGGTTVIIPNSEFTNGVVHTVSDVIALPTVATFATADPTYSTLELALTADSNFSFVSALSSNEAPAPFTVFAPTDAAFASLLTELQVSSLTDLVGAIGIEGLEATLNYHVIANANVTSSALQSGTVTTLGGDLTVDATATPPTLTDANGRVVTVVATDVQASNGVIHAIDTVILPEQS